MSKMNFTSLLTCSRLILGLTICVSGLAESGNLSKTFRSGRYGYVVRYPGSWHLDASLGNLEIENFPPSRAERGSRLPKDGAAITLLPCQAAYSRIKIQTLDDCISLDHKGITPPPAVSQFASPDNVTGRRGFNLTASSGKILIIEVRGTCCDAVPPLKEYVEWYFEVGGTVFRSSVEYWKGNPKAVELLSTMQQIVLSFKLDSTSRARGKDGVKF
jgi:hypothetical protein